MPRPRTVSDTAILAAAARLIAERGLPGTTLAAVAAETGLAPATLVQRFGSKRGLLLALAAEAETEARRPFERARREHPAPLAALRAALAALAGSVHDRRELANHLTFLRLDLTDPEFHRHARTFALTMRDELAALLDRAVDAGELAPGRDTVRLARTLQVAYNGALIVWALTGDGSPDALLGDVIDDVLLPHLP